MGGGVLKSLAFPCFIALSFFPLFVVCVFLFLAIVPIFCFTCFPFFFLLLPLHLPHPFSLFLPSLFHFYLHPFACFASSYSSPFSSSLLPLPIHHYVHLSCFIRSGVPASLPFPYPFPFPSRLFPYPFPLFAFLKPFPFFSRPPIPYFILSLFFVLLLPLFFPSLLSYQLP